MMCLGIEWNGVYHVARFDEHGRLEEVNLAPIRDAKRLLAEFPDRHQDA